MLEINYLYKSFKEVPVLKGISFKAEKGEILGVLGSSGGGKTTLLRCINNLEKCDRGTIKIKDEFLCLDNGVKSIYPSKKEILKIRKNLGLVFQNFNLFPHMSVIENIIEAPVNACNMNKQEAIKNAGAVLKNLGLLEKSDSYPYELSGGQKQRAAIARALILNPDILCFDEPTSALDPELREGVAKIIQDISENRVILLITHDISFAKRVCSRIIFIDNGEIIENRPKEDFFNDPLEDKSKIFLNA
ncbi:MAG: amino acid ABC transporter ATP-binding protein [Bacillota bacterium]|nr:amino acid ABC transporter ATP-binding protein [Bacillota bacterium]